VVRDRRYPEPTAATRCGRRRCHSSVRSMGEQTASPDSQLLARIRQRGPGTVFMPADFVWAPVNAADLALSRNARVGPIRTPVASTTR
jgi:hypothetical protein